jgi:hypothetical protein
MIKTIRCDSPPCNSNGEALRKLLSEIHLRVGVNREELAELLGRR